MFAGFASLFEGTGRLVLHETVGALGGELTHCPHPFHFPLVCPPVPKHSPVGKGDCTLTKACRRRDVRRSVPNFMFPHLITLHLSTWIFCYFSYSLGDLLNWFMTYGAGPVHTSVWTELRAFLCSPDLLTACWWPASTAPGIWNAAHSSAIRWRAIGAHCSAKDMTAPSHLLTRQHSRNTWRPLISTN